MLATYTVAARSFDLLLPTAASVSSIFLRICWVWPLASAEGSPATMPARYTVSPWTTAWLNRGPTPCRLIAIAFDPFRSGNGGSLKVPQIILRAGAVRNSPCTGPGRSVESASMSIVNDFEKAFNRQDVDVQRSGF